MCEPGEEIRALPGTARKSTDTQRSYFLSVKNVLSCCPYLKALGHLPPVKPTSDRVPQCLQLRGAATTAPQ